MTNNLFSVESKSQLAKLLATENINIQHQKIPTAAFDPKSRTLYCPIWEKMDGPLYDLLMGHEVGHAHDTPAEGWHDAVSTRGKNYKGFLNVVEDARIEKRIKRRYPGLRKSFVLGYNDLLKRNFFGIKDKDVNVLPFIDRLNLFTKSDYTLDVEFNDTEKVLLEKVKAIETWQDTLDVTELVWEYSKQEQSQLPENYEFSDGEINDNDNDGDDNDFDYGQDQDGEAGQADSDSSGKLDPDADDGEKANKKSKDSGDESDDEGEDGDSDSDGDAESDDAKSNAINRFKQSNTYDEDFDPVCETDNEFRKNEQSLVDKSSRNYNYVKLPTPNLKNIITSAKVVNSVLTNELINQSGIDAYTKHSNELYVEFKRKNERFISMLAKEFEMRKAADKFSKVKVSTSGDIDISKLYKFQTDDNIFRKMAKIPKGKSHGLVLLLDKSGSMNQNMASSIEQILILVMFCRKVNIPFTVYGFGNAYAVRQIDFPETDFKDLCFSQNENELEFRNVYLREYINSRMGNAEFQNAVKNLVCLMSAFETAKYFLRPRSECLSNTPMTEALVALQPLINEFRRTNGLDIVNLAIVHDGDADEVNTVHLADKTKWLGAYDNNILSDTKSKLQIEVDLSKDDGMRIGVAKWLAKTTGVKIFGFFLVPEGRSGKNALYRRFSTPEIDNLKASTQSNRDAYFELKTKITEAARTLRKEKFLESKNAGYDSFYMLPDGNDLSIDDDEIVVTGKVTTTSLTKAFMKYSKDRKVNRVLVTKFIQGIAA